MKRFEMNNAPAPSNQIFIFDNVRISVISDRILRVEKSETGNFCDKATQMVVCRNFCETKSTAKKDHNFVIVFTENGGFKINLNTLEAEGKKGNKWVKPSNKTNLGGTARTLDGTLGILGSWKSDKEKNDHFCFGHIRKGIFSLNGIAEIDDSKSFIFNEDGSVSLRENNYIDKYIFNFGDDYLGGLKEFYQLCGATPLLPKYSLGNWWSRYHAYTQDEYEGLMDEFEKRNIPLTVATIDMDWHIVDNVPEELKATRFQSTGWTGYTFEKSLFPDYKAFFKNLKERNLAVTMNLHPADGVRFFEVQYEDMCKACGINPDTKEPIRFNLTNETFRDAYFDILHHPYEKDGVDFWWIDWQQGTSSKEMMGLDPLWLLNHYHFLDINRDKKDGIILSRYAGLGSHRYPLGFSGDTYVCWKSLDFQPWFTANASNAGYTWWSHDIGGHIGNRGNNELYLRWLQYGVFSPINRLHSNNKCMSKEPWNYPQVEKTAEDFLRLRHRMLPYIYSANVETNKNGIPLICPMYYYDNSSLAFDKKYKNQYYFGGQLIVAPVTQPTKKGKPNIKFYLPEGEWTDIFTGKKYTGGEYSIYCPLDKYPVFAKSGAIIPMLPERNNNSVDFDEITVDVYPGKGEYIMYDDDGEYIEFMFDGEKLKANPSSNCKTRIITVKYIGSNKPEETIEI